MPETSALCTDIITGRFKFKYEEGLKLRRIDGLRCLGCFLVDGKYPAWSISTKPITHPRGGTKKIYTKRHEAIRKDIEKCFGVQQARVLCLRLEKKLWFIDHIVSQSHTCVILHNMIIEVGTKGELANEMDRKRDNVVVACEPLDV